MDKKTLLFLSLGIVGVLYVLWNVVDTELDEDESEEASPSKKPKCATPFIPTHEWQEVKEGQAVPPVGSVKCSNGRRDCQFASTLPRERTTQSCWTKSPRRRRMCTI